MKRRVTTSVTYENRNVSDPREDGKWLAASQLELITPQAEKGCQECAYLSLRLSLQHRLVLSFSNFTEAHILVYKLRARCNQIFLNISFSLFFFFFF